MIDAARTRDLPLDSWGPYSKHYAGYSHILPDGDGAMLDIVPLVGRDRGRTIVPDVNFESSYHVTAVLPDLSYISYRYQLRWKDVETADVELVRTGSDALCRITYANNGEAPATFVTSLISVFRPLEQVSLDLPDGYAWIGGEEYVDLRPSDDAIGWAAGEHYEGNDAVRQLRLGKDGLRKGVTVSPLFVGQLALGTVPAAEVVHGVSANRAFVFSPGTVVRYELARPVGRAGGTQTATLRYRMAGIDRIAFTVRSGGGRADVELCGGDAEPGAAGLLNDGAASDDAVAQPCLLSVPVELDPAGDDLTLEVTALEAGDEPFFALDGIVVGSDVSPDARAWFTTPAGPPRFTWERTEGRPGVLFENDRAPGYRFYLESADERPVPPPPYSDATITHVYHRELAGTAIERKLSNDSLFNWYHVNCTIGGDGGNHFLGYNLGPFVVEPGEVRVVDVAICAGRDDPAELRERAAVLLTGADRTAAEARAAHDSFDAAQPPSEHAFGVRTLRHYTVSNVTYPIRIGSEVVRTYTPGRRWGGLFTWDSGMHGIGLAEYAPGRAAGILDQYLPRSESDEVPVVLHGTPLPLHVYLLGEIARHEPGSDLVRRYYRRALLYWSYFAGLHADSTYDDGRVGMLCSYSDGYNSLGVDDYPVQHYEGTAGLYGRVKTVSTTAHAIRAAKILRDLASLVGEPAAAPADPTTDELTARIDYLSRGLQEHAWNPKTGWFEHVRTDTLEPVLTPDGQSYNMGFDGVAPLVAGVCTDEQRRTLVNHVMSEREMWTPHGITAVSQAAPYFRRDGYWNGKVWIPHQWFLWKAMITEGEFDHAATIATTALRVFDRAARASYCSWELFDSRSGMGEGCHQFGGLSAPLAAFHNAYFAAGRFTPGFDTLVVGRSGLGAPGGHWIDLASPNASRLRGIIRTQPGVVPEVDGAPLDPSPAVENVYRLDRRGTRCRLSWRS